MTEEVRLKRQLGLLHGVSIVAGLVIGVGIFVSPGGVILHTGSAGLSLVMWVVGGILSLLGSLTFAEIGLVIPQFGAHYAYLRIMYGRFVGFLFIWTYLFFVRDGGNAISASCSVATFSNHFFLIASFLISPLNSSLPHLNLRLQDSFRSCFTACLKTIYMYIL